MSHYGRLVTLSSRPGLQAHGAWRMHAAMLPPVSVPGTTSTILLQLQVRCVLLDLKSLLPCVSEQHRHTRTPPT